MSTAWNGSGTVVHPAGLILTNCHVANPRAMGMPAPAADRLAIALTDRSDEPPVLTYFAEIMAKCRSLTSRSYASWPASMDDP
jgi:serine protease Do